MTEKLEILRPNNVFGVKNIYRGTRKMKKKMVSSKNPLFAMSQKLDSVYQGAPDKI